MGKEDSSKYSLKPKTKIIDGSTHRAILEAIEFALAVGDDMLDGILDGLSENALSTLRKRLPTWKVAFKLLNEDTDQLPS